MTATGIQCDQCSQRFQPKRVNKSDPSTAGTLPAEGSPAQDRAISDEQRIRDLEDELAQNKGEAR